MYSFGRATDKSFIIHVNLTFSEYENVIGNVCRDSFLTFATYTVRVIKYFKLKVHLLAF